MLPNEPSTHNSCFPTSSEGTLEVPVDQPVHGHNIMDHSVENTEFLTNANSTYPIIADEVINFISPSNNSSSRYLENGQHSSVNDNKEIKFDPLSAGLPKAMIDNRQPVENDSAIFRNETITDDLMAMNNGKTQSISSHEDEMCLEETNEVTENKVFHGMQDIMEETPLNEQNDLEMEAPEIKSETVDLPIDTLNEFDQDMHEEITDFDELTDVQEELSESILEDPADQNLNANSGPQYSLLMFSTMHNMGSTTLQEC